MLPNLPASLDILNNIMIFYRAGDNYREAINYCFILLFATKPWNHLSDIL